jgi:hypothetical protein
MEVPLCSFEDVHTDGWHVFTIHSERVGDAGGDEAEFTPPGGRQEWWGVVTPAPGASGQVAVGRAQNNVVEALLAQPSAATAGAGTRTLGLRVVLKGVYVVV